MKRLVLGLFAAGLFALAGLASAVPASARGTGMIFVPPGYGAGGWPGNGWNGGPRPWNPNGHQNGHWSGPRYPYHRPGYNWYYGGLWYPLPWWRPAWGFEVGENYGYYGSYRLTSRHVRWCLNRYRSYNPRTDTFTGYDGRQHRCRAPY